MYLKGEDFRNRRVDKNRRDLRPILHRNVKLHKKLGKDCGDRNIVFFTITVILIYCKSA